MPVDLPYKPKRRLEIGVLTYDSDSGDLFMMQEKFGNVRGLLTLDRLTSDQDRTILTLQEAQILAALMQARGKAVNLRHFIAAPRDPNRPRNVGHIISRLRWIIGVNYMSAYFRPDLIEGRWYFDYRGNDYYAIRPEDFNSSAQVEPPTRPKPRIAAKKRRGQEP